jgi:hypothetical protein
VAPLLKLGVGDDGGFNPAYLKLNKMQQEMIIHHHNSCDPVSNAMAFSYSLTPCRARVAALLLSALQLVVVLLMQLVALVPLLLVVQEATPSPPR